MGKIENAEVEGYKHSGAIDLKFSNADLLQEILAVEIRVLNY